MSWPGLREPAWPPVQNFLSKLKFGMILLSIRRYSQPSLSSLPVSCQRRCLVFEAELLFGGFSILGFFPQYAGLLDSPIKVENNYSYSPVSEASGEITNLADFKYFLRNK